MWWSGKKYLPFEPIAEKDLEKEQSLSKELDEIKLKVKVLSLPNRVTTDEFEFVKNMEREIVVEKRFENQCWGS